MAHRKFYTVLTLDGEKRFATKKEALAFVRNTKLQVYERIVPENVKPGSKEHLGALSRFFGL